MKIIHLANCGLLVQVNDTKILIDGLFKENDYFDAIELDEKTNKLLLNLDAILFTHTHFDHYDKSLVDNYLVHNPKTYCFISNEYSFDKDFFTKTIGDATIYFFKIPHSGKEFKNVIHYTFLINGNDKNIYISGDADFNDKTQIEILRNFNINAAFFNPLYLQSKSGINIIKNLNPLKTYIYHLPSEKNGYRI